MKKLVLALLLIACDTDNTFMTVCEVGGDFYYPQGYATSVLGCEEPVDIIWDHMPLTVRINDGEAWDSSIRDAEGFWERQVDIDLFNVTNSDDPDIDIFLVPGGSTHSGAAWHERREDGSLRAFIELYSLGDSISTYYIIAHEYGHVLGLAHDAWDTSIMNPYLDQGLMIDFEEPGSDTIVIVTGNDKKALRERYR